MVEPIPESKIKYLRNKLPAFFLAVDAIIDDKKNNPGNTPTMLMTLEAFFKEPELLHDCIWYLNSKGVDVFIATDKFYAGKSGSVFREYRDRRDIATS
jgi:hypothetical protein